MKRQLTASVWREGGWYIAQCLEVDVASQGKEMLQLLIESAQAEGDPIPEPRRFSATA